VLAARLGGVVIGRDAVAEEGVRAEAAVLARPPENRERGGSASGGALSKKRGVKNCAPLELVDAGALRAQVGGRARVHDGARLVAEAPRARAHELGLLLGGCGVRVGLAKKRWQT
jgi:hypothetical protein